MPIYRVYRMTADGRIAEPSTLLSCETDQEAIERATALAAASAVELWQGGRWIRTIPAGAN